MSGVIAGNALGESGAKFLGGGGHENAGPEELGKCCGDAGGSGQDQGDAADHGQNRGRSHRTRPFASRRGAGTVVLIVTGFSFRGRVRVFGVRLQQCLRESRESARHGLRF